LSSIWPFSLRESSRLIAPLIHNDVISPRVHNKGEERELVDPPYSFLHPLFRRPVLFSSAAIQQRSLEFDAIALAIPLLCDPPLGPQDRPLFFCAPSLRVVWFFLYHHNLLVSLVFWICTPLFRLDFRSRCVTRQRLPFPFGLHPALNLSRRSSARLFVTIVRKDPPRQ